MSLFSSLGQGANDIWSITGINFASPVNDILDKENFTIEELLQEDELLQEVKSRNGRLIEFMTQEEVMDKLINFIISNGDKCDGDMRIFKYPYMSCEVLCCEIPDILHILVEDCDGKYLRKLFSMLDSDEPLDHYLAGYFEKTLEMLFRRMTIPIMTYLNKSGISLLKKFLKHINNYSIMQIVQRLLLPHIPFSIGTVDLESVPVEDRQNCQCNWSFLEETCGLLCTKMMEEGSSDVPSHVSDLLITVLQLSPPDAQFISHLCDPQCLEKLFHSAFAEGAEISELSLQLPPPAANVSLAAISVLESLVSRLCETMNPFDAMGVEMQPDQLQQALNQVRENIDRVSVALIPSLSKAAKQLQDHVEVEGRTPPCGEIASQTGVRFRRLGHRGLQLVKLVEAMLKLGNSDVDAALCEHRLLHACLDLMFQFELHSLLHFAVQRIVVMTLEGGVSRRICQKVLFTECNLLQKVIIAITEAGDESSGRVPVLASCRRPIIGHLIQIAQAVTSAIETDGLEQKSDIDLDVDNSKEEDESWIESGAIGSAEAGVSKASGRASSLQSLIEEHGTPSYAEWELFTHTVLQRALDVQISSLNTDGGGNRSPALLMESLPRPVFAGSVGDIDDDDDDDDFNTSTRPTNRDDGEIGDLERSLDSIALRDETPSRDNAGGNPVKFMAKFSGNDGPTDEQKWQQTEKVDAEFEFATQFSVNPPFQADFEFAQFETSFSSSDNGDMPSVSEVFANTSAVDPFFSSQSSAVFEDMFADVTVTATAGDTQVPTFDNESIVLSDESMGAGDSSFSESASPVDGDPSSTGN